MNRLLLLLLIPSTPWCTEYASRVAEVRKTRRFAHHLAKGDTHDLPLGAVNYVREYRNPFLGRGPFGQAIEFRPALPVPSSRKPRGAGLQACGRPPGRPRVPSPCSPGSSALPATTP